MPKIAWTPLMMSELPPTRGSAIAAKKRYFFTGKVCSKGHMAPRVVPSGKCLYCRRLGAKAQTQRKRSEQKLGNYVAPPANKRHGLGSSLEMMLWQSAKNRARMNGRPFSIKVTDIAVPKCCPVFGTALDSVWGARKQNNADRANAPSLDRIDPRKGYVPGNVIVLSYRANMLKGDGLPDEHRKIAAYISSHSTS